MNQNIPAYGDGETEVPLPEKWTRVYFTDGSFVDYDVNAANIVIDACEDGKLGCTVITSFGETHWIRTSEVQVVCKRNKTALINIWREGREWEKLRKEHQGEDWES